MNSKLLMAVGLILAGAMICPAAEVGTFAFQKDVVRPSAAGEEILGAVLDGDVYEATEKGMADFRIFDAQAKEVPYRLDRVTEDRTQTTRKTRPAKMLLLSEDKEHNRIELVVDQEENWPVAGLTFGTPLRDYERRVSVLGSDDRAEWKPLVSDAVLFDYSRYADLRNDDVALPENRYRYFKVLIEEVTERQQSPYTELTRQYRGGQEPWQRTERSMTRRRPLRIDRIACYENVVTTLAQQAKQTAYPVEFDPSKDITEDPKTKQTILEVRSRREPLTRFTLAAADKNFSRAVSVRVPVERGVATDWVEIGRGTISMIRFHGFQRDSLAVDFPEQRSPRYRIVIDNRDNPPLAIENVSAEGNAYQAVFFALPDGVYRAYYGAESIAAPDYDVSPLAATLAEGYRPLAATLGPQVANPALGSTPAPWLRKALHSRWLLGGAIGLMVVVLTLILFRAGRRIEDLSDN